MTDTRKKHKIPAGRVPDDSEVPDMNYVSSYEEALAAGHRGTDVPMPDEPAPEKTAARADAARGKTKAQTQVLAGPVDLPLTLLIITVTVVGLIMLFSASYTAAYYKYGDAYYFITRQTAFSIVGLVVMWIVSRIPYQRLHGLAFLFLAVAFVLLVLVLFIGTTNNTEAKRWLSLGPIPSFQPSEIAKAALILSFASLAVRMRDRIRMARSLLPFLLIMGAMSVFLLRQPHLSATMIILITGLMIMFLGGANLMQLGALTVSGVGVISWLVFGMKYQYDRIASWLNPWADPLGDGFQILQSLYAVGSGGLWGLGLGQSRQKQMYLPEPYNDFIFAIVCEELGFIGATLIILLFAALVIRGFYVAMRSRDTFGTLLVAGVITQIAVQAFLNIGVVTGLLPVTGASLPFFSSGGSSMLVLYAELGVVLSVSRQMTGPRGT